LHRYAVTQATGSGGATTFLQSTASGSALQGEVASTARTSIKLPFGVLGEYDAAGSTFGIGVAGVSTTGYGVGAEATASSPAMFTLNTGTGDGLDAFAQGTGAAIYAEGKGGGAAITSMGDEADGIDAGSQTDQTAAVYGLDASPDFGYGVYGYSSSPSGYGLVGESNTGIGLYADSESATAEYPALQVATSTNGTELFDALVFGTDSNAYESTSLTFPSQNYSTHVLNSVGASNDLQLNGDVLITGGLYTACKTFPETAPKTDCADVTDSVARNSGGAMVQTYGSHHASPTMEDEGEAHLTSGYAHVSLDPTFASSISTRSPYLVFTTPQGDGPGLFVTNRSATGFDVRQSLGGHSNMTFDYRIVAHPFGRESARIAIVTPGTGRLHPVSARLMRQNRALRNFRAHHALAKRPQPRSLLSFSK
jgi:hypothetical protein